MPKFRQSSGSGIWRTEIRSGLGPPTRIQIDTSKIKSSKELFALFNKAAVEHVGTKLTTINFDSPKIWQNSILKFGKRGSPFSAKTIITGFSLGVPSLRIGPLIMRPRKEADRVLDSWPVARNVVAELRYCMPQNTIRPGPASTLEPASFLYSFCLALQLIIDSWVGMLTIHHFNKNGEIVATSSGRKHPADVWHPKGEPVLQKIDEEMLIAVIRGQSGKFKSALHRYGRASSETMEEALVDFTIVIDGLLGHKIRSAAHRFASRGAFLLSKNKRQRQHYYHALRYLYKLRSDLVHGETAHIKPPKGKQRQAFARLGIELPSSNFVLKYYIAEFARSIARKVLLFFFLNEEKHNKEWLEELELGLIPIAEIQKLHTMRTPYKELLSSPRGA